MIQGNMLEIDRRDHTFLRDVFWPCLELSDKLYANKTAPCHKPVLIDAKDVIDATYQGVFPFDMCCWSC